MRAHGVGDFPDPTTTPPTSLAGYSAVFTVKGAIFALPASINLRSPAVKQAEAACDFGGPPRHGVVSPAPAS